MRSRSTSFRWERFTRSRLKTDELEEEEAIREAQERQRSVRGVGAPEWEK
jgi:hypothetical protein